MNCCPYMMRSLRIFGGLCLLVVGGLSWWAFSAKAEEAAKLPVVFQENFEKGADHWKPTDPNAWKVETVGDNHVYSQFQKSNYKPPHRSPFNFALLKDVTVGDFVLQAKLKSTVKDYNHRDMCLIFGYQDPAHFYYVHLGKKTDDHANQIFIVNDAPRTKISSKTTDGTPWDDEWHNVKIVRNVSSGLIQIFYDDMEKPIMEATDKNFVWGQIGIGSFDDVGQWDDLVLSGTKVEKPE